MALFELKLGPLNNTIFHLNMEFTYTFHLQHGTCVNRVFSPPLMCLMCLAYCEWLNVLRWFSNGQFPGHAVERTRHSLIVDFINFFGRLSPSSLSLRDFDSPKKTWKEFAAFLE